MYAVKFVVPKKLKNLRVGAKEIKSFVIREVDGADEEVAANTAKARGGASTNSEELVRLSVVEVNGEPVKQPYLAFDTWNSRARAFVLASFRSINSATEAEVDDFLLAAQPVEGGVNHATSDGAASEND